MLGNKRKQYSIHKKNSVNKTYSIKPRLYKIKNKSVSKNRKEDEEIASDSENEISNKSDMSNDDFFERDNDEEIRENEIKENADSKRLRLARSLISNIEGKIIKDNVIETENGDRMNIVSDKNLFKEKKRDLIDDYLKEELKKENNEMKYEFAKSLNPKNFIFLKGHKSTVTQVDISTDSKYVISSGKDARAIKWDLTTYKKIILPQFSKKPLLTCMWAPDNKTAFFAGADRYIYHVDVHNEKLIHSFKAHNDTITGMIFDTNGEQFYSIGNDKKLNVWGVTPSQKSILLETFYGHTNKITDLDILITNKVISCGIDNLLNLWKIDTQSFLKFQSSDSFSSLIDNVRSLNPSTLVSGGSDGTVTIWKTNKKKPQNKIQNAHGFFKEYKPVHDFFYNEENFLDLENNLLNFNQKNKFLNKESDGEIINNVKIPNPICSLETIKNSDLIFSGSLNGNLNIYRYFEDNKIEEIKNFEVGKGCINSIKVNKTNEFLVLGYGKDQRLGRWYTDNGAKSGISIVKLFNGIN